MQVGLLTGPFGDESLEHVIAFASENGFDALEVAAGPGAKHIDTAGLTDARAAEIKSLLKSSNVAISSLA